MQYALCLTILLGDRNSGLNTLGSVKVSSYVAAAKASSLVLFQQILLELLMCLATGAQIVALECA